MPSQEFELRQHERLHALQQQDKRLNFDVWRADQQNRMDWIRLKMEYDVNVQKVIGMWIENQSKYLDLVMKDHAFKQFQHREKQLKRQLRTLEIAARATERRSRIALSLLEGPELLRGKRHTAWRCLGHLIGFDDTMVPATDGSEFVPPVVSGNSVLTVYGLIQFCARNHVMIKPASVLYELVMVAWHQARQRETARAITTIEQLDADEQKLTALQQGQWRKAGVIAADS